MSKFIENVKLDWKYTWLIWVPAFFVIVTFLTCASFFGDRETFLVALAIGVAGGFVGVAACFLSGVAVHMVEDRT